MTNKGQKRKEITLQDLWESQQSLLKNHKDLWESQQSLLNSNKELWKSQETLLKSNKDLWESQQEILQAIHVFATDVDRRFTVNDQRFDRLEGKVENLETDMSSVKGQLFVLQKDLTELKTTVKRIDEDLGMVLEIARS